jgi:hypothetical protein
MAMLAGQKQLLVGVWLLAVILLLGCSTEGKPSGPGREDIKKCTSAPPPAHQMSDSTSNGLRLTPSKREVVPGEVITITVEGSLPTSAQLARGVDAYLECWTGREWTTTFILLTGNPPSSMAYPLPPRVGIEDLRLLGPGPEPVQIPKELSQGWYRIRKAFRLETPNAGDSLTLYAYVRVTKS